MPTIRVQLGFPMVNANVRATAFLRDERPSSVQVGTCRFGKRRNPYAAPWLDLNAENTFGFQLMLPSRRAFNESFNPNSDSYLSASCSAWSSSSQLANSEIDHGDENGQHPFLPMISSARSSAFSDQSDRGLWSTLSSETSSSGCSLETVPFSTMLFTTTSSQSTSNASILIDGEFHGLNFGTALTISCHSELHVVLLNVENGDMDNKFRQQRFNSGSTLATTECDVSELCVFELSFWRQNGQECVGICTFSLRTSAEAFELNRYENVAALAQSSNFCILRLVAKNDACGNSRESNNCSEERFVSAALEKLLKAPDGAPRLDALVAEIAADTWAPPHAAALLRAAPGVNVFNAAALPKAATAKTQDQQQQLNCVARKKAKPKYHRQVPILSGNNSPNKFVRIGIRQMLAYSSDSTAKSAPKDRKHKQQQHDGAADHHHHPAWKQCGATFSTMMRHFQKLPALFEWCNDHPAGRTVISRRRAAENEPAMSENNAAPKATGNVA